MSRIVIVYGSHLSRFKPRTYTIFFCASDMVSLVLQGAGGGISSTANTSSLVDVGKNIMLAGLGFQVFSLVIFIACSTDFAIGAWKGAKYWKPQHLKILTSLKFSFFLIGLAVVAITIFARSTYRCIELSGGLRGKLFVSDEILFMVMEGAMISIACFCLTWFHPVICFQGVWHQAIFSFPTGKPLSGKQKKMLLNEGQDSGY